MANSMTVMVPRRIVVHKDGAHCGRLCSWLWDVYGASECDVFILRGGPSRPLVRDNVGPLRCKQCLAATKAK